MDFLCHQSLFPIKDVLDKVLSSALFITVSRLSFLESVGLTNPYLEVMGFPQRTNLWSFELCCFKNLRVSPKSFWVERWTGKSTSLGKKNRCLNKNLKIFTCIIAPACARKSRVPSRKKNNMKNGGLSSSRKLFSNQKMEEKYARRNYVVLGRARQ